MADETSTNTIVYKSVLDPEGFERGLQAIYQGTEQTFQNLRSLVGKIAPQIAAALTVAGFEEGTRRALKFGSQLYDVANSSGYAAKAILAMSQTSVGAAGDIQKGADALGRMDESVSKSRKEITGLGLDFDALRTKAPEEQFRKIQNAVSAISDPVKRAAAGFLILGSGGAASVEKLSAKLSGSNAVLAAGAERVGMAYSRIQEGIASAKQTVESFFNGVAVGVAPGITSFLGELRNIDLSGVGLKLGQGLSVALEVAGNLKRAVISFATNDLPKYWQEAKDVASVGVNAVAPILEAARGAVESWLAVAKPAFEQAESAAIRWGSKLAGVWSDFGGYTETAWQKFTTLAADAMEKTRAGIVRLAGEIKTTLAEAWEKLVPPASSQPKKGATSAYSPQAAAIRAGFQALPGVGKVISLGMAGADAAGMVLDKVGDYAQGKVNKILESAGGRISAAAGVIEKGASEGFQGAMDSLREFGKRDTFQKMADNMDAFVDADPFGEAGKLMLSVAKNAGTTLTGKELPQMREVPWKNSDSWMDRLAKKAGDAADGLARVAGVGKAWQNAQLPEQQAPKRDPFEAFTTKNTEDQNRGLSGLAYGRRSSRTRTERLGERTAEDLAEDEARRQSGVEDPRHFVRSSRSRRGRMLEDARNKAQKVELTPANIRAIGMEVANQAATFAVR